MHIKRLEIDNFKSFANKVEIPFLPGFTAVAGPNGSGKSNIIDSILFALGLSSARALRSEKGVADLITTHNSRNEAFVKVIFDLENGEEISFARRVKKATNGFNSTYYMDDKPCTLMQMHSKLEQFEITPNSNNIIMQGDVVGLVNCSSVERRKFIDEIAGTADFDRKIDIATNELASVNERVGNSTLILTEINSNLEQLAADREIAIKYRDLKEEKEKLESEITTVKYFDFKRILELLHESILKSTKDKKNQEIEIQNNATKIDAKKTEYDEICAKVRAQGEDKQLEVKKQAEEKKGEIQRKKDSIIHADKTIFQNNKTVENSKNGIEDANSKKKNAFEEIEKKEVIKTQLAVQLSEKKAELTRILTEVTGLNKAADTYVQKRNALRSELDTLKEAENTLIREKLPKENDLNNIKNELVNCNKTIEELENNIKNHDSIKDKLSMQIEALQKEMEECKTVQKLTFEELDKTKAEASDLAHGIQLSHRKIAELEANRQAFKTYGLGAGVETIMQSNIKGVHAPLLQLAEVDGKYTEAIGEALGGRSRFVIVDDEHVASRAVEILKSQGRDRATFLPLNKLKPAPSKLPLPKGDGVIDYAINLLDFDDRYIDAFYFALGETLVVSDMNCAKKLMGRYRIVTLEGEIFERSGAITGGARRKNTPAFGKADDKELQVFKDRLIGYEKSFRELEEKKRMLENRLEKVRTDYSNASNVYNGAKIEFSHLISGNDKQQKLVEENYKRINDITPLIKKIEGELDKFEAKHVEVNEKISTVQEEIVEVEKFIDEGELSKLKEMTQGVETAINELERKIMSIENDILREKRDIDFYDTTISHREIEINRLIGDNKSLEVDKQKFELEIDGLNKLLIELEETIVELGKSLVELQEVRQKIQNEMLEAQKNQNILENEIERIKEAIESYKSRRHEIEPQLEEATNELKNAGINLSQLVPLETSIEEITSKISKLQRKMDDLGDVNMRAITTYDEVLARQSELKDRIDTLEKESAEIQSRMQGYETLKKETFLHTYENINEHFKDIFAQLTDGSGTLVLENPENPFMGGLTVVGQQKNKEKQKLAGMSGGEKTLMALSLVFAVQRYLPAPFYALDEVDAALDGFNVERISKMIAHQAGHTQFVVISQRQQMIESADRMIGVSQKGKGITEISGITLGNAAS